MKKINLGEQNTLFNHFISEIRNVKIQKDSMRFRRNIERIGDQSTNIAELIIFAQTGEIIEDSRVKIDESAL